MLTFHFRRAVRLSGSGKMLSTKRYLSLSLAGTWHDLPSSFISFTSGNGTFVLRKQRTTRNPFTYIFCFFFVDGPTSSTLNYVNLRVITNAVCQQTFGSIIIGSTVCAAGISSSAQGVCSVSTPLIAQSLLIT